MDRPKRFGPYELIRPIAVGGMAEIYLAKTRGIGGFEKTLCLKTILPTYTEDQHFTQMLVEEAKLAVQLSHVNIVQIFDLGRIEDTYFIAMEYVEGADVHALLRQAAGRGMQIPFETAAFIVKEVCAGLDYAHRKRDADGKPLRIIHRDISPQNVLISLAGEVKIVDFGIAKAATRGKQTEVGVIKGKFYYMSPEQAWGDPVDGRTDVFSAGILLYELLTGQMAYRGESVPALLDRVRKADIPAPTTRRKDIPPLLVQIVTKAIQKSPDDRYATAHEFRGALEQFLFAHAPDFTAARLASLVGSLLEAGEDTTTEREMAAVRVVPTAAGGPPTGADGPGATSLLGTDGLAAAADEWDDATLVDDKQQYKNVVAELRRGSKPPDLSPGRAELATRVDRPAASAEAALVDTRPLRSLAAGGAGDPGVPRAVRSDRRHAVPGSPPFDPPASTPTAESPGLVRAFFVSLSVAIVLLGGLAGGWYWLQARRGSPELELLSMPAGGAVWLDGSELPGMTPLRIRRGLRAGKTYRIEIRAAGYQPWSGEVTATRARLRRLAVLVPLRGRLTITSAPDRADIFVNGSYRGQSPLTVEVLDLEHEVQIEARLGGRVAVQTFRFGGGREGQVRLSIR